MADPKKETDGEDVGKAALTDEAPAIGPHQDAPEWLEQAFADLNATHFEGKLKRPEIAIYQTPGTTTGATQPAGDDLVIFIAPRIMDQDRRWAQDTLLHEMIHVALHAENGDGDAAHGERFTGHANRIGATMGLPEVLPTSRDASCWPQGSRSATYPPWEGDDCPIPRSVELAAEVEELVVELPLIIRDGAELIVHDEDD